jgi:hypothetical protein
MAEADNLWWGYWQDYPKQILNGVEYAVIGTRLYTRHAVERFLPSGRRTIGNVPVAEGEGGGHMFPEKARSIPPRYVEETIVNGFRTYTVAKQEARTVHVLGDIEVVTTRDDHIVITIGYRH